MGCWKLREQLGCRWGILRSILKLFGEGQRTCPLSSQAGKVTHLGSALAPEPAAASGGVEQMEKVQPRVGAAHGGGSS